MGVHLGINDDLTEKQKAELEIDDVTHFILRKQKSSGIVFTDANFYKYQIYFTPYQATSIIFHLDPYGKGNEHHSSDFKAVQEVLKQYVECKILKKSRIKAEKDPFLGDIETIQIHRDDLTFFVSLLNIPSFNGLPEIPANKESEPDKQIAELQARIAELEAENQNLKKPELQPTTENKTQRISQPQRDIFTLLTVKNYPDCQSRNRLFEAINADLRANGITTKDIKYSTLDKLIDENIRTGSPIRSPFPPKQS